MGEVIAIFSLAAGGCLVRVSTDLALQFFARRLPTGPIVTGPLRGHSEDSVTRADPLLTVGFTLACYGGIALVLVSELPGELPFQRTLLAFALMCVGGLIGEISRAGSNTHADFDDEGEDQELERTPASVGLSVALMLVLNLAVAVLAAGRGLIPIVPPHESPGAQATELEQIVVVARRRPSDPTNAATFL